MSYFWPGSVSAHWGPGPVDADLGPGPVNAGLGPGPVNAGLGPGGVDTLVGWVFVASPLFRDLWLLFSCGVSHCPGILVFAFQGLFASAG